MNFNQRSVSFFVMCFVLVCVGCASRPAVKTGTSSTTSASKPKAPRRGKLKATAHSVTLTWTASITTPSSVAGYNVYASGTTGGPYAKKNSAVVVPLTYVDTAVTAGQTLFYVITTVGTNGQESMDSAEVSVTVPNPSTVAVSITPTSATVQIGKTQQFTATVTGSTTTTVTWTAVRGSVSTSGLYTAPSTSGTDTVTATGVADTTKSASATVTVTTPVSVSVTIAPTSASVQIGATQQFTGTVTGSTTTTATYSAARGTITSGGLYTAPSTPGTDTVTAKSVAAPTQSASVSFPVTTSPTYVAGDIFAAVPVPLSNTIVILSGPSPSTTHIGLMSNGQTGTITGPEVSGYWPVIVGTITGYVHGIYIIPAGTPPPPVAVSIAPVSAIVLVGATQQFTATVTNTTQTTVTWSAQRGTVTSSGLYTAPTTAGADNVTATSVADPTKSATVPISVTVPVSVSIAPTSASVQTGLSQQFTATVTGSTNTAVTWTAARGTVGSTGLYTAPTTAGADMVTATSVADTTKSAAASITVTAPPLAIACSFTAEPIVCTVSNATSGQTVNVSATSNGQTANASGTAP